MMIDVENIHCVRNNRSLFSNISFSIASGELLQVVGNNGVGKSSLLRIVAGLLIPQSGNIFLDQQQLFYLGHSLALKSTLTISENITYSASYHYSQEKIKKALQYWSLEKMSDQLCGALSQGQQQRVALARLQLCDKKIWILDEPFSNLDSQGVLQLEQLLQAHLISRCVDNKIIPL